jgi:hypothetical protein
MERPISCDDLSTGLVLVGLTFELGAVIAVARKFIDLRELWTRLKNRIRKPPAQRIEPQPIEPTTEVGKSVRLRWSGTAEESRDARSLDAIHHDLRALEKQVGELKTALEARLAEQTEQIRQEFAEEVVRVTRETVHGDEAIREEIREQTVETLAEQKVEASYFAGGLALQIVAAILLLAC